MSDKDQRDEPETEDREPSEESEAADRADEDRADEDRADDDRSDDDDERPRTAKSSRPEKLSKKARREEAARVAKQAAMTRAIVIGVVSLAVGAAAGWFGHIEQAKAKLRSESAPAAAGSAGPCGAWEKKICTTSGDTSATCQQAKGATSLLTPGTCEAALEAMPATLAKVKAERAPCDSLMSKLCKDLPPESKTCAMIKERTPQFASERCKEMLQNYDQVLAEVQQIERNPPMGMPGHGADDGHGH